MLIMHALNLGKALLRQLSERVELPLDPPSQLLDSV